jgi:hypothetical protein
VPAPAHEHQDAATTKSGTAPPANVTHVVKVTHLTLDLIHTSNSPCHQLWSVSCAVDKQCSSSRQSLLSWDAMQHHGDDDGDDASAEHAAGGGTVVVHKHSIFAYVSPVASAVT